jgi:tetratricopeptide (TPR) repeat protein
MALKPMQAFSSARRLCLFVLLAFPTLSVRADDFGSALARVDELETRDQLKPALEILEDLNRTHPDNPAVLYRLSEIYADMVDVAPEKEQKALAKQALIYAQRAVARAPRDAKAHLALAVAYGKMADFVDNRTKMEYSKFIKSEAERTIQLDPRNDDAYEILARWNFEMATLNPILAGIAKILYGELPPASKERAFEYFNKAIAISPNNVVYHAEYAKALERSGQTQAAKAEWRKVLQLRPLDDEDRRYQREAAGKLR